MTMHLAHPALSMGGKRKGKVKFKNVAEAQRARELDHDWKELQKKWGVEQEEKKRRRAMGAEKLTYKLSVPAGRSTSSHIPSLSTGEAGTSTHRASPQYTGTEVLGVTIVHKSCLQPVFNQQEAIDAATMRR